MRCRLIKSRSISLVCFTVIHSGGRNIKRIWQDNVRHHWIALAATLAAQTLIRGRIRNDTWDALLLQAVAGWDQLVMQAAR